MFVFLPNGRTVGHEPMNLRIAHPVVRPASRVENVIDPVVLISVIENRISVACGIER